MTPHKTHFKKPKLTQAEKDAKISATQWIIDSQIAPLKTPLEASILNADQNLIKLEDLKRQQEIAAFRYHTRDVCTTLIKLIIEEIESWPETKIIPEDTYISLANTERLIVNDVSELCQIYRKVILLTVRWCN